MWIDTGSDHSELCQNLSARKVAMREQRRTIQQHLSTIQSNMVIIQSNARTIREHQAQFSQDQATMVSDKAIIKSQSDTILAHLKSKRVLQADNDALKSDIEEQNYEIAKHLTLLHSEDREICEYKETIESDKKALNQARDRIQENL
jgi:hypothetical protein